MRLGAAQAYGRWLNWLALNGRLDAAMPWADRVTPDAVVAYVGHLKGGVSSTTVATYLRHLHSALNVMATEGEWTWLRRLANRLHRGAIPRDKRGRVVLFSALYRLGLDVMERAEAAHEASPLDRASLFRDGLLIALLAARPMRMANLVPIGIGRHLVPAGGDNRR